MRDPHSATWPRRRVDADGQFQHEVVVRWLLPVAVGVLPVLGHLHPVARELVDEKLRRGEGRGDLERLRVLERDLGGADPKDHAGSFVETT